MRTRSPTIFHRALLFFAGLQFVSGLSALAQQPEIKSPSNLVVLIGGMDSDPTPEQIAGTAPRSSGNSGMYRLQGDIDRPEIQTEYFNWNGTRAGKLKTRPTCDVTAISEVIRSQVRQHPQGRVVLIGNSWGGHTTFEVCESLVNSPCPIAIDHVIFLDASSTGRAHTARPKRLPMNIVHATNIYTRNVFGWRNWPKEDRIENIDLGDSQHGYLVRGGPAYDSSLDFSAHVAAEWDERIHAAIRRKVLDLTLQPAATDSNVGNRARSVTAFPMIKNVNSDKNH